MRPEILNPLFASAQKLPGIGSKLDKLLGRFLAGGREGARIIDLLWHLPSGQIDRRNRPAIADAPLGEIVTLKVLVDRHFPSPRHNRRVPYKVRCHDETGELTLVFFHAHADYLRRVLPEGEERYLSGRIEEFSGALQMTHPDHVLDEDEFAAMPEIEPVYPMTAGLSPKTFGRAVRNALELVPDFPEWQDPSFVGARHWPNFRTALTQAHVPAEREDVSPGSPARERLAYDELLSNQLALALVRRKMRSKSGRAIAGNGELVRQITSALPFDLTGSQKEAVGDILADMSTPTRMLRLLQGDVGSGKTVVALIAMATAVEAGLQAAIMAPTEILARQHFATIEPLCREAGISIALLTGRDKGRKRDDVLESFRTGAASIAVGTHALFQDDVAFHDLGLAIIDEQHRFGVHQRLALQSKNRQGVDVLVMTATPIPRTLTLTHYGDMDVSRLTEKPAGRQPVDTRVLPLDRLEDVIAGVGRAMERGERVYWVCPLVEESEEVQAAAAQDRFDDLSARYPGCAGLIHGRMKGPEKDAVMASFQSGDISILVATTVIEVGVDVPEASIMIIEHAERFGLAQMHQLRGRVGRGTKRSSCVLLYDPPLGEIAASRLKIMRETDDGFLIAEEDLRLRGAGELLGTRQSGMPEFRMADLAVHADLLAAARDDAALVLARDEGLTGNRGEALRALLYLFERDDAVRLLSSG